MYMYLFLPRLGWQPDLILFEAKCYNFHFLPYLSNHICTSTSIHKLAWSNGFSTWNFLITFSHTHTRTHAHVRARARHTCTYAYTRAPDCTHTQITFVGNSLSYNLLECLGMYGTIIVSTLSCVQYNNYMHQNARCYKKPLLSENQLDDNAWSTELNKIQKWINQTL